MMEEVVKKIFGSALMNAVVCCFLPILVYDRIRLASVHAVRRWKNNAGFNNW